MSYTPHEVRFLLAHKNEIQAISEQLELSSHSQLKDLDQLRSRFGEYARAVMELIQARKKAATKLPKQWLMCHESAQQATALAVAQIRMQRLAQYTHRVHDVTCSIGTEGAAATAAGLEYHGSDLDFSRILMARNNVPAGLYSCADATVPAASGAEVIIADPARRSHGRRISSPEDLLPPLPTLIDAWGTIPMAIKCAPGLDFRFWNGLVSLVSVDGGVKEACLYSPELVADKLRREAVVIKVSGQYRIDDSYEDEIIVDKPGKYIVDPDGAIVRAGLVRHYGHRENLWMLDEHIAYLSGDQLPAGTSGFEFIESVSLKKLKSALAAHGCGSLEILVRGVNIDPDQLRKKLKLSGNRAMAVVIARIAHSAVAMICNSRTAAVPLP
ncbi:SAM-dependent methyltransferase [Corynebacterium kutscheri]|uniref:SAM-dependent methyltransferase n=1 Tax=Corynebacterium kutscheri TaxID=35755 RepID=A0AB38VVN3_9CORY|nr:SAM-dependent methyltransferase [Corynebacterium kutscheri]VEH06870.1 putative SAM-dependent methyltransferase [Corynebacterium kutscheri]